jgi:uncharacterized protein (UPF0332 family)
MLDRKRIEEAENNVKRYLAEGLLTKAQPDRRIVRILVRDSKESLRVAEEIKDISHLWVIVCSYYSMFYHANAVLRTLGYKIGDKIVHKVTADALIVFVRGKLKQTLLEEYEKTRAEAQSIAGIRADTLIESFDFERGKRNTIQYETSDADKLSKAMTSLARAKEFAKEMEKLLI